MSMSDVPEVSDDAFVPPDLDFDDEAAGKVTEWERLLADVGDDVGEPDPVLGLLYGRSAPVTTDTGTGLATPNEVVE